MSTAGFGTDVFAAFDGGLEFARRLDAADPLASMRAQFLMPRGPDGREQLYLCGNSLGLQPRRAAALVNEVLTSWAQRAVEGHFHGEHPWYPYHEFVREPGARLVGGLPHEVVFMNGLTVNLHLLMATFYRPTRERYKILIEDCAFPSDNYVVRTQLAWHGFDAPQALLIARPRPGEHALHEADVLELIEREGPRLALVLMSGVNYFTGQVFDLPAITQAAHAQGALAGFDLAHAVGNVRLALHDWNVDFAAWCSYKYLNAGPGALAGAFVHERHARDTKLPRLGGWWSNDPRTRFAMHTQPQFLPLDSADGWQLSNPPILSTAPLIASLELFDQAGMPRLLHKSRMLSEFLIRLLHPCGPPNGAENASGARRGASPARYEVITPLEPQRRGSQLSLLVHERPRELQQALLRQGVVCDFREPNVVRAAPVPLYNTFEDVWRFAQILNA